MNIASPNERVDIAALAEALHEAELRHVGIEPLTNRYPDLSVSDAYAVQRVNIERRLARGERLVGRKIGLTSLAMQQQLGVNQPDYGAITDAMVIPSGGVVDPGILVKPRLEAEFAFEIATDLPVSPTFAELVEAVSGVAVAMEVIDSRVVDWRITLPDTVADNASMARVVWGEFLTATPTLLGALPGLVVALSRDDVEVCSGPGSAVLGDPLESLHWLAQALGAQGDSFKAGDRVLAGAVAAAVDLAPGSAWRVQAEGFTPARLISTSLSDSHTQKGGTHL